MLTRGRGGAAPGPAPDSAAEHALAVLEVGRVLRVIAEEAASGPGAARVAALAPLPDADAARGALAAVEEMRGLLERRSGWTVGPLPDVAAALGTLAVEGSVLESDALRACGVLLATSRVAKRELETDLDPGGSIVRLAEALCADRKLEERIEKSFDDSGDVADSASRELARLRRGLRDRRAALVGRLEAFARELPERVRVPDASVTLRGGRYCVSIRREGRAAVGGLVHDESATRQTLFVEPPIAIEPMNEIRELELAEAREVRRILKALTDALRPSARALAGSFQALAELDSLAARARFALAHRASVPELGSDAAAAYRVRGGRHPLLFAGGEAVVPFDLELSESETVLLISGPNAGGKTVLLKSLGLFSVLAQSGVIPPIGPGTRLPFFDGFFAMIGDEQSIEASLSTFGAQVRNLAQILEASRSGSLVLIDEIGSATDPAEGSALAAAVLARLSGAVRLTVATTHLGSLKTLSSESDRIVNASLQFDADRLEPTFQLVRDRPGRSYALEIASRLGLPAQVLDDARVRLGAEGRAVEELLRELERDQAAAATARRDAERLRDQLSSRADELAEREALAERKAVEVEKAARTAAQRYLLEARSEVEAVIERLEGEYGEASRASDAGAARGRAKRAARGSVERALRDARDRDEGTLEETIEPDELHGARVRLRGTSREGRVVELRGSRAVVEADGLRLTLPAGDLEPLAEEEPGEAAPDLGAGDARGRADERRPELGVRMEVDFRGLRVDEVESALLAALDAALVADLPWLRIIHGKGTGALRERVREILAADGRVPAFRPGDAREGGAGVTVVEFQT